MLADLGGLGRSSRWNDARRLMHAISDMRVLNLFGERRNASPRSPIVALGRELDAFIDLSAIRCRLMVAATNVTLGMPTAFYANCDPTAFVRPSHSAQRVAAIEWRAVKAERFAMAILASAALPGLFAPVELEFEQNVCHYADGSLVDNSPIGLAIDAGATDITVVFADPVSTVARSCPQQDVGRMACAVSIFWQQRVLDYELRLVEATNALIRAGALQDRQEIRVQYVRPEQPIPGLDLLAFDDADAIARAFQQGAVDGERELRSL